MSQLTLLVILMLAGIGSASLVAVSTGALLRRRSWSYFLVTLAIGTLTLRTFLGAVMVGDFISPDMHHTLEHLLDVLVIGLLFGAVYLARTIGPTDEFEHSHVDEEPHD